MDRPTSHIGTLKTRIFFCHCKIFSIKLLNVCWESIKILSSIGSIKLNPFIFRVHNDLCTADFSHVYIEILSNVWLVTCTTYDIRARVYYESKFIWLFASHTSKWQNEMEFSAAIINYPWKLCCCVKWVLLAACFLKWVI